MVSSHPVQVSILSPLPQSHSLTCTCLLSQAWILASYPISPHYDQNDQKVLCFLGEPPSWRGLGSVFGICSAKLF